jgi:hypothetical protein
MFHFFFLSTVALIQTHARATTVHSKAKRVLHEETAHSLSEEQWEISLGATIFLT